MKSRITQQILIGLLFSGLSAGTSGLFYLKDQMGHAWQQALGQFQWLVLVQGDPVQIDEVGRFLRQQDAVADVTFITAESNLARFSNDPNLAPELQSLGVNPFPPCWKVTWKESMLDPVKMQETLQDARTLPGVVDVATDQKMLEQIHIFRLHWYQVKVILSSLALLFALFAAVLFGRFLFFSPLRKINPRAAGLTLLVDAVFWLLGWCLISQLLGPVPPVLLTGGVAVGLCRLAW